ncbi:hypothetical protein PF005_g2139 [Phytophthora fragariae]|uniref:Uncharacterized protein n=1 Tax=Phytophthora fragariae TaxID=53985 RepID=A0A6A3FQP8_9STRA|nr:hypothetical protein PF003_g5458 [Phytophthora fragariae]KAE8947979.1 hypothetical protein PF009_g2409 [Phytophthora fragariae]KAE9028512.1 hypothetical protein PF011_g1519 [Phytophthora fragariae]KAE9136426.1 hypothetical protein PF007_g2181 [Phytophthora fragariae]KAE9154208.1 hypothetical protein PF006_g1713 [Phytophthora fragariae]
MTSRAPPASRAVVVWFIPARSARCSSSLHYCVGVPPSLRFGGRYDQSLVTLG